MKFSEQIKISGCFHYLPPLSLSSPCSHAIPRIAKPSLKIQAFSITAMQITNLAISLGWEGLYVLKVEMRLSITIQVSREATVEEALPVFQEQFVADQKLCF